MHLQDGLMCACYTCNIDFVRLLAQMIRLKVQFLEYAIKIIRLDIAGEFTSQTFNDYCLSTAMTVEHPVAHVHTQNGLVESLVKRLQLIARPLLMRKKLPVSILGNVILHAAALVRIRPTSYHDISYYNWIFVRSQIFPIVEFFIVWYMFQFLHHNAQKWVPKEDWGYMLDVNLVLLLNI